MAYKVFTNGSPLPASDLNTYLMNQSVMVFANSTARSAALTSPTEGMTTYLEDTNKVEVWTGAAWTDINDNSAAIPKSVVTTAGDLIVADGNASVTRLGIGTNGQVLSSNGTTATWITPAGGGGETLIASTTFGPSQPDITSIPNTYKDLKLVFRNFKPTSAAQAYFRFNGSTSNYAFNTTYPSVNSISSTSGFIPVTDSNQNDSTSEQTAIVMIYDYANSSTWKMAEVMNANNNSGTSTSVDFHHRIAVWKNTSAINRIQIQGYSATSATGDLLLYGVS